MNDIGAQPVFLPGTCFIFDWPKTKFDWPEASPSLPQELDSDSLRQRLHLSSSQFSSIVLLVAHFFIKCAMRCSKKCAWFKICLLVVTFKYFC